MWLIELIMECNEPMSSIKPPKTVTFLNMMKDHKQEALTLSKADASHLSHYA